MTHLPVTTHTIEMAQIADINSRLATRDKALAITAAQLGLEGATVVAPAGASLPPTAVLVRLGWDGPPEFPYIHGHFSDDSTSDGSWIVGLHTRALQALSHRLSAQHVWGLGSVPERDKT
jgi:hypothetical protein